jgi:GT2 family glycosyltransferase
VGDEKFWVRGVTYGTFRPGADGALFPVAATVERDFADMAANGLNAVRTYTVPPRWLLDAAQRHGLRVMVGLPWEEHVTFLDDSARGRLVEARVRAGVRACAGHPAVLCYAVGNEIPAPIVRWHGRQRVERHLERLYRAAKAEDPEALVTYVNYPSTEYLQLPFLDVACFNVYLESQERLEAYLARLHNLSGDRPLILAEVGRDSRRHGEDVQAQALDWQVRAAFATGCAGAFVFAWTDEWHRGGYDIEDWDFGLTRRDRAPKPALAAVREAFAEIPFPKDLAWPRISVIVCSYNGARTIRDCFEGLVRLEYPNFEVIVVSDGSTDATPEIAREYGFRLISTGNRGLSRARNTGMEAASGEIVAYIDDDARPDPHWLTYLAVTFMTTTHGAVGGPNIAPADDGPIADCVANAPGGPIHVLLSDRVAEHIPGCNMAIRKAALQAVGGFDPQFWAAGDDVDVCWRLQQAGWTIGFAPGAMVWHHRRNSTRAYWKQQRGYGKAEALLEQKWPHKYNTAGHVAWAGRLYGRGLTEGLGRRRRIYHGTWGAALFQSIYEPAPGTLSSIPLIPEWYLIILVLAGLSALGAVWTPLLFALPLLSLAVGISLGQAALSAARASLPPAPASRATRLKWGSLIAFLHLLQPLARLVGRRREGLTPWRRRGARALSLPWPQNRAIWSERWRAATDWLHALERALRHDGVATQRGGDYDRWDLEIRVGLFGAIRVLMAIEEHGAGKQLVRVRSWPWCSPAMLVVALLFGGLATCAIVDRAVAASAILATASVLLLSRACYDYAAAAAAVMAGLRALEETLTNPEAAGGAAVPGREWPRGGADRHLPEDCVEPLSSSGHPDTRRLSERPAEVT